MRKSLCLQLVRAAGLLTLLACTASAGVLTFEDIPCCGDPGSVPASLIPNGYSGFNWTNFGVEEPLLGAGPTGGPAGIISSPRVAYNGWGLTASLSTADGSAFNFESVYITSVYRDAMNVDITAYRLGVQVDHRLVIPDATSATLYEFDWNGIDQLSFAATGGTVHPGYINPYGQAVFVMDNFTFQSGTPEPAGAILLCSGFAALIAVCRRAAKH